MPSTTYNYTGAWQKFVVPNGVKIITVTVEGAGSNTVQGGYVNGKMRVAGKDALWILVGERGRQSGEATFGAGGRGGGKRGTGTGGWSGGGASVIRLNTRRGRNLVVAGGAGGQGGGPNALGGPGGARVGQEGAVGTNGAESATGATGGTQAQAGVGGTSALGPAFRGGAGANAQIGRGGTGGEHTAGNVHGGGGGGGGFFSGGGGAAGRPGVAPSSGGGGGSNFIGGLYTAVNTRGAGGTGHGRVVIQWDDPNDPNQPPVPPENIRIEGKRIRSELPTKAKYNVLLKGTPDDPDQKNGVRLYVKRSRTPDFTNFTVWKGTFDATEQRDFVHIRRLRQNTLYYLRIYTQDHKGKLSRNYRATSFWTNRSPLPPTLTGPAENSQFTTLANVTFTWTHRDPDPGDGQNAYELRYRAAATPSKAAGPWTTVTQTTSQQERTVAAGAFRGNTLYEWQVRTRDPQELWGDWSQANSFYVTAATSTPLLLSPSGDAAVVATAETTFRWRFRDPDTVAQQLVADLRYRVVGTVDWNTLIGDSNEPGRAWEWTLPPETFAVGYRYEWQVRTRSSVSASYSEWSDSAYFWGVAAPSGVGDVVPETGEEQPPLGQGQNRVYIYDRGGIVYRGEIKPVTSVRWTRKRDDLSHALVFAGAGAVREQRALLSTLRTWQHEIVIFRDGKRVFDGPITRISTSDTTMEIEAKDVMGYVYRRIMRQGYNDSYRLMNGIQLGQATVVERATQIVMNCLAYDDPNVLAYLSPIHASSDATTSRIVKDYTRTAWEEIDDLAATAGLDYVTVGRRIVFWDTHSPIGRLPEMRDGDFSESVIVTEYGMSAANHFGVTNNDGVWGAADKGLHPDGSPPPEGFIEQLASAYGESEVVGTERELTRVDKSRLEETLTAQAGRNIEGRWPPPIVVRVPDNAYLSPDLNIGINQLVPGVWIPLRVTNNVRTLSQWQKLDSIEVNQTADGETIGVVMSPAPQGGLDPDAEVEPTE